MTGFCFSSDESVTGCLKVTTASAISWPPAVRLPANVDPGARAGHALLTARRLRNAPSNYLLGVDGDRRLTSA